MNKKGELMACCYWDTSQDLLNPGWVTCLRRSDLERAETSADNRNIIPVHPQRCILQPTNKKGQAGSATWVVAPVREKPIQAMNELLESHPWGIPREWGGR